MLMMALERVDDAYAVISDEFTTNGSGSSLPLSLALLPRRDNVTSSNSANFRTLSGDGWKPFGAFPNNMAGTAQAMKRQKPRDHLAGLLSP
jgi:hypothetical protein